MKKAFYLLVLMLCTGMVWGQDVELKNVSTRSSKFRGVQEIEGLGYFAFVQDSESSGKVRTFKLHIWDYDLKEIAVTKEELPKTSKIIDADFNGEYFMVASFDTKKRALNLISYDKNGKKSGTKNLDDYKMDIETESMKPTFYPDGDRGFFGIVPGKDKNFGYALIKLDNDLRLKWRKPYFAKKTVQQVIDAQSDENKLIILKSDAAGGSRKKMDVEVVAYSSKSGSELWTYKVNKEDRLSYPTEMALNHKGELAIAGMFFYGDKFKKKNSDGIFFKLISPEGKIIGESDQDWDGELQKYMRESNDGPFSLAKPKVVFEDILFDAKNGEVKVVGELFVDASALTSVTLSGAGASGRASAAFSMRNLLFFTFSSDGSLVDFYDVEKATQKVSAGTPQKGVLGVQIAKQRGLLPYQFTTVSETGELICIYVDYVTEQNGEMVTATKAAFSASALGILNLNQSSSKKVVKTYLPFSKKAAGMADSGIDVEAKGMKTYVSGGLPGKLLLSFYLQKEKTLKLFLVDIN